MKQGVRYHHNELYCLIQLLMMAIMMMQYQLLSMNIQNTFQIE